MREFGASFTAHIATGATSLCTCWLIERSDGNVLGFSDHDRKIEFGGNLYLPAHGLESSEVATKLGAQVDTSQISGILHSAAIDHDDIILGRYDNATVKTFAVNWADVSMHELLRVDTIGEITREDGFFRAELRSSQEALNKPQGRRYQTQCDVLLGDTRCGVTIEHPIYKGAGTITLLKSRFAIEASGLSAFASDWFSLGRVSWLSGKRLDLNDRLQVHELNGATATLNFVDPVGDWVAPGDLFHIYAGCDRRFSTCKNKFSNGSNFQGFPHIPGNDFILSYPKSTDDFSGSILIS